MKIPSEVGAQLQHTLELLKPVVESICRRDRSGLFLSVAPGLAEEAYGLVREALGHLIDAGWLAGRRGRITKTLVLAAGDLQEVQSVSTAAEAEARLLAALRRLTSVVETFFRCEPESLERP